MCVTPTPSYPPFPLTSRESVLLPAATVSPSRVLVSHCKPPRPPAAVMRPERGTSRASIFRVKDGATDAIGPRRGLPRWVVVYSASHRSRLRPMRSPESQPLASCRPRPATYPDCTDTPSGNLQLSHPPRAFAHSLAHHPNPFVPFLLSTMIPHRSPRVFCYRLLLTPSNLSARPVLATSEPPSHPSNARSHPHSLAIARGAQ